MTSRSSEVAISLPYRERAATALIEGLHDRGRLGEVVTPRPWKPTLTNRARSDIDVLGDRTSEVYAGDILRKAANKTSSRVAMLASMHISKRIFDRHAAPQLTASPNVLAFPGACKKTFQDLPGHARKIFHAVDAHPRSHNEALLEHLDRRAVRAELYPNWLVDTIEEELELADVILVPSKLVETQMLSHGVSQEKILVRPYGVDVDLFTIKEDKVEITTRQRPLVLYVGQISQRKGLGTLISAVKGMKLSLLLVGNLFDKEILADLPANVSYLPPQSHESLAILYNQADVFALPTLEDACSLVALEAAAVGIPVITTFNNGAAEILPEKIVTIVPPGDVAALRTSLSGVETLSGKQRLRNRETVIMSSLVTNWDEYVVGTLKRLDA